MCAVKSEEGTMPTVIFKAWFFFKKNVYWRLSTYIIAKGGQSEQRWTAKGMDFEALWRNGLWRKTWLEL